MNLFPLSRCASATKMVLPLESIVATQPQVQPALLTLPAIISQYFTWRNSASFVLHPATTSDVNGAMAHARSRLPRVRLSGRTYLFGRCVHVNSHRAGGGRNQPHPVTRHRNTGGCSERVAHFFCGLHDPPWLCRAHYVLARVSSKCRCAECEREHDTCASNRRTA